MLFVKSLCYQELCWFATDRPFKKCLKSQFKKLFWILLHIRHY